MIIDTTKHLRRLLDLKLVPLDKLTEFGVSLSKEVIECWYLGKDQYHCYGGYSSEKIHKLQEAGARTCFNPVDSKRACNNCGRYLEDTKKQQAFGRLYKCPGCSVAWWGRPTSLPANAETRNARRLTANMMKLVKELAPSSSLKHDVRPLGCLNLQECRIESIKLTDLNASEKKRRAIIYEAVQQGILNNADRLMAEELVDGYKSIQGNTISKISADQCNHNWGWVGIDEACTHCGVTKKELLFGGGQEVEVLKEPQDLYDDAPDGWLEKALKIDPAKIINIPPGFQLSPGVNGSLNCAHVFDAAAGMCVKCGMLMAVYNQISSGFSPPKPIAQSVGMLDPAFCPHNWDFAKDICKLCGITKEALYLKAGMVQCAPVQEPKPARLIDLE